MANLAIHGREDVRNSLPAVFANLADAERCLEDYKRDCRDLRRRKREEKERTVKRSLVWL